MSRHARSSRVVDDPDAPRPEPHQPTSTLTTITPEMAEEWLKRDRRFRPLRRAFLDRYHRDMLAGRWRIHAQAIEFDANGNLINGTHRLTACIMAGVPFRAFVARGMPPDSIAAIDNGATRRLSDYLRWRGEPQSHSLGSIIKLCWAWERGQLKEYNWDMAPSVEEAIAWYDQHPGLHDSVAVAGRLRKQPLRIPTSVGGAWHYRAAQVAPDDVEVFVPALLSGTGLGDGNPVLVYRRWLGHIQDEAGSRTQREHLAYLLKTFNAWRVGQPMKQLHWRPSQGEKFPELTS